MRTAPVPVDLLEAVPQLAGYARTATRLHPRPHQVSAFDGHVGGPLRWPVGEPWPTCDTPPLRPASARVRVRTRHDASYREVAMVPGWKVGGWPGWSATDVLDTACHRCAGPTMLLLVVDSSERDPHDRRWQPADDPHPDDAVEPTGIVVGRFSALRIFACLRCPGMPFRLDQQ